MPDNIALLPLPPYAPELNSTENIGEYLRRIRLSHRVWDTYKAILDACCDAWNELIANVQCRAFPRPYDLPAILWTPD